MLDYRLDTALPIRQLTQILLRGVSTLTEGERELIAAVTSYGNECRFCTAAHTAAADLYLGDVSIAEAAKKDPAAAPVSAKMKALLVIARACQKNGRLVTPEEPAFYDRLGHILQDKGYLPSPDRYKTL